MPASFTFFFAHLKLEEEVLPNSQLFQVDYFEENGGFSWSFSFRFMRSVLVEFFMLEIIVNVRKEHLTRIVIVRLPAINSRFYFCWKNYYHRKG